MSVILKQFDGGAISPRDDAILYNSIIQRNGIFNGCEITHLGANQLKITAGRGIIKGRTFEIEEMTVNCQLASYGTQKGRMYLRMELSNLEAPIQIKTVAATSLPDLVQEEDCNYTNGVYEMELCTYNVTDVLISDLKMTYDAIDTAFPIARSLEEAEGVTDPDVLANALSVGQLSRNLPIVKSVTGSFPSAVNNWSATVAYPEGFTKENCIPVAIRSKQGGSSREYYNASGAQQIETTDSGVRVYLESAGNAYVNGQFIVYLVAYKS